MANQNPSNDEMIVSYMALRKAIGLLGFLLPWVLVLGTMIMGNCREIQSSISHYYYTVLSVYFTGTLCAVSFFMFSYKGYHNSRQDRIASLVSAVCSLGVAFFPTDFDPSAMCQYITLNRIGSVNSLHYISACILFSTLAYFCLALFTKSSESPSRMRARKRIRNDVYVVCGWLIIACIVLMGVYHFVDGLERKFAYLKPVLVLESIALMAFGFSWLVKGEAFLRDKP